MLRGFVRRFLGCRAVRRERWKCFFFYIYRDATWLRFDCVPRSLLIWLGMRAGAGAAANPGLWDYGPGSAVIPQPSQLLPTGAPSLGGRIGFGFYYHAGDVKAHRHAGGPGQMDARARRGPGRQRFGLNAVCSIPSVGRAPVLGFSATLLLLSSQRGLLALAAFLSWHR